MARSLGIPARVAVGYTWGDEDPANPGTFQVLGRNAHAWPEVYLGEYGWVPFEPTPGRGNPDATDYTGVAAAQEDGTSPASTTTTTAPETSSTTTSTVAAGETASAVLDRTGSSGSVAGNRCGDSNATAGHGHARNSLHTPASAFSPRGRNPMN